MEKILVTGCAGFIGSHVSEFLLKNNKFIIGLDNLNNYYDVNIKKQNVEILSEHENFFYYPIRSFHFWNEKILWVISRNRFRYWPEQKNYSSYLWDP